MLSAVEETRLRVSKNTDPTRKSQFGQFFTPEKTAQFMAGLFTQTADRMCRLIDPGAGIGSLSSAFLERCISGSLHFEKIEISAFELDDRLHDDLETTLATYATRISLGYEIRSGDFIEDAVNRTQFSHGGNFTHAILNPPYKKISGASRSRLLLRQVDIETVNLYSAFVALTLELMSPGGQLVAIIPRSFCNGPYYRPFRRFILSRSAIRHMHLFASRNRAFKDDGVLQENIIIMLERDGRQDRVTVSASTDDSFTDLVTHSHSFDRIVLPGDRAQFIHVPASAERSVIECSAVVRYSLEDLGIDVSTGPVIDFRLKDHLRSIPEPGTVPLLYPGHFGGQNTEWPKLNAKKPNAIRCNVHTERWLYPSGWYCVVRRFSSKEEQRRIVASVVDPELFGDAEMLGFENHLNIFHESKHGLPKPLVHGLATFLNATAVDESFRCFNGHTQVNATDLRLLRYPDRAALIALGEWAMHRPEPPTQEMIDERLDKLTS